MFKCIPACVAIILIGTLFSCTATKYVYTPESADLLQVEQKGEVKAAGNFAKADRAPIYIGEKKKASYGINIQAACAISKRIVVKVDAYRKWESNKSPTSQNNSPDESITYNKYGAGLSAGIYNFSKDKNRSTFQLFGGIGTGNFSFKETYSNSDPANHHAMNYFKTFIQPSLSFKIFNNYTLSIAGKLNWIKYHNIHTDFTDLNKEPLGLLIQNQVYLQTLYYRTNLALTN